MGQVPFGDNTRRDIEDLFFLKQDRKIIEQLRAMEQMKESKEALAKVSGIKDDAVLEKLVKLSIRPETLAALSLIPLIEVAWADGKVDEKEREATMRAAEVNGLKSGCIARTLLEQWLTHKPEPKMLDAWKQYVKALSAHFDDKQRDEFRAEMMGHARSIAEASGGFLGLGSKVSKAEEKVLTELENAF